MIGRLKTAATLRSIVVEQATNALRNSLPAFSLAERTRSPPAIMDLTHIHVSTITSSSPGQCGIRYMP